MKKLRYVFSGTNMFNAGPRMYGRETPEIYDINAAIIREGVEKLRADLNAQLKEVGFEIDIDILFNAVNEPSFGKWFIEKEKYGMGKIYADSGGLQVISVGKQIDDALKREIYEIQSVADYAFCFDEIPVQMFKFTRLSKNAKLFQPSRIKEKARKTAQNVLEQIDTFRELDSETKVLFIVQGNNRDDMLEWFSEGVKVLGDDHMSEIAGVANAFSCLGRGDLETIENVLGYYKCREAFGPAVTKNHLHLLGIGSPACFLPAVFLFHSGNLIPDEVTLSFDSSRYSMSYMMGKFYDTNKKFINKHPHDFYRYFRSVFDYFEPIYRRYVPSLDREKFLEFVVENRLTMRNTLNLAPEGMETMMRAHITLSCLYQLLGFVRYIVDNLKKMKIDNGAIGMLQYVKNEDDYGHWLKEYGRFVKSIRIARESENTLCNFFG